MALGTSDNTFLLNIVSGEGMLFSGQVHALAVTGADGELGIRPGHSPLISKIKPGAASYTLDPKKPDDILYISGGMLEVQPDVVNVLADTALHGKDIDKTRAEDARQQALQHINQSGDRDNINYEQAQLELTRALAQLRVIELLSQQMR